MQDTSKVDLPPKIVSPKKEKERKRDPKARRQSQIVKKD
jgi:hypothetical protein